MAGTFEMKGAQQVAANVKAYQQRAKAASARGLLVAAERVLAVSNSQVPHEEGDLERDGKASVDAQDQRAAVSYGRRGDVKDYAVVQHEDMTLSHDPGRNAKYLENAFSAVRPDIAKIVAETVRRETGA